MACHDIFKQEHLQKGIMHIVTIMTNHFSVHHLNQQKVNALRTQIVGDTIVTAAKNTAYALDP